MKIKSDPLFWGLQPQKTPNGAVLIQFEMGAEPKACTGPVHKKKLLKNTYAFLATNFLLHKPCTFLNYVTALSQK